jgi:hypothetical protein
MSIKIHSTIEYRSVHDVYQSTYGVPKPVITFASDSHLEFYPLSSLHRVCCRCVVRRSYYATLILRKLQKNHDVYPIIALRRDHCYNSSRVVVAGYHHHDSCVRSTSSACFNDSSPSQFVYTIIGDDVGYSKSTRWCDSNIRRARTVETFQLEQGMVSTGTCRDIRS